MRERRARENQHRGGGVDVEIEELDRGADEAGEEDLPRRVDGSWKQNGRTRAHRRLRSFTFTAGTPA